jgi:hypothetical protein
MHGIKLYLKKHIIGNRIDWGAFRTRKVSFDNQ